MSNSRAVGMVVVGSLVCAAVPSSSSRNAAQGAVKSIEAGKTTVTVEVMNKGGPNGDAPKAYIWISKNNNPTGPDDYEPAGIEVPLTNGNGKGSAKIANVSDELKKGRTARTGTNRPNGVSLTNGGAKVAMNVPQGTLVAGMNVLPPLDLTQSVAGDENTLLETWDAGSLYRVSLDPAEAHFVNLGASVQTDGDLQMELVDVTPQAVTIRVLGDPTLLSNDDAHLLGLGIHVLGGAASVGLDLGWQGTTSCYVNGEFLVAGSASVMESHEWTRLPVTPEPASLLSAACAGGLLLLRRRGRAARGS